MAARCARLIAEHEAFTRPVIIHHGAGKQWSSQMEKVTRQFGMDQLTVGNVNDDDAVEYLKNAGPDIVFSVNNWDVIHAEVLAIPGDGIVNFHNGPLPEYRGVNIPSWAIMNGERRHAVTWHFVTAEIDAGDIVATKTFDLSPKETAISLTLRCIKTGLELFSPLLDQYASGSLASSPQKGEGCYYSAKVRPPNEGYLDFNWRFDRLSAIVRGLTFRPFENPFTYPKIRVGEGSLLVSEISFCEGRPASGDWICGEIRGIDSQGIVVRAQDGLVRLSGLMEEDLRPASIAELTDRHGLTTGSALAGPAA
jgi:methionyl-tRNA formyltransferase